MGVRIRLNDDILMRNKNKEYNSINTHVDIEKHNNVEQQYTKNTSILFWIITCITLLVIACGGYAFYRYNKPVVQVRHFAHEKTTYTWPGVYTETKFKMHTP